MNAPQTHFRVRFYGNGNVLSFDLFSVLFCRVKNTHECTTSVGSGCSTKKLMLHSPELVVPPMTMVVVVGWAGL